ncbi:MAG: hypothetical protein GX558_04270 [Clostridiales bacterium]|nr:hypothetical protein [Clostridiales bacterium]
MGVRTLHQTDLFHPHQDPDDHYDLACQFALAARGDISLQGVLIDWPPSFAEGDPDVMAVAQLNAIAGLSVPAGIGSPMAGAPMTGGERLLLRALESPGDRLTIHIVGSCRDVASAIGRAPDLFRERCAAIYLNAGSAVDNGRLEYNVELDPASYAGVFSAPCPVYWMPCFHAVPDWGREDMAVGRHGTFYRFVQRDLLDGLSPAMQNYFLYMLTRSEDPRWLKALSAPVDAEALARFGALTRNMWCTGGFLHAAALSVDAEGNVIRGTHGGLYDFVPVDVRCAPDGRTEWQHRPAEGASRFLFTLRDEARYPAAMTRAMGWLLRQLT